MLIAPYDDFVRSIKTTQCTGGGGKVQSFSLKNFNNLKFKLLRNDSSDVEDEYVLYPGKTFYCQIDVETNELENMCPGLCVGGCSYSMTPKPIDETCIPKKLSIFNDIWKKSTTESAPVVALECSGKSLKFLKTTSNSQNLVKSNWLHEWTTQFIQLQGQIFW